MLISPFQDERARRRFNDSFAASSIEIEIALGPSAFARICTVDSLEFMHCRLSVSMALGSNSRYSTRSRPSQFLASNQRLVYCPCCVPLRPSPSSQRENTGSECQQSEGKGSVEKLISTSADRKGRCSVVALEITDPLAPLSSHLGFVQVWYHKIKEVERANSTSGIVHAAGASSGQPVDAGLNKSSAKASVALPSPPFPFPPPFSRSRGVE